MSVDNTHRDDQDLERYGVWVKAGPNELNDPNLTNLEFIEIEDPSNSGVHITEEEEKLLEKLENSTLPDFDDFADKINDDSESENFNPFGSDKESIRLLHNIEDEVNTLREEINHLKNELMGLRSADMSSSNAESLGSGGFFEEESDETIALTGNELDNILESADMTNESIPMDQDTSEENEISDNVLPGLTDPTSHTENVNTIELPVDTSLYSAPENTEKFTESEEHDGIKMDIPNQDNKTDKESMMEESMISADEISSDFEDVIDLDDIEIADDDMQPPSNNTPEEIFIEPLEDILNPGNIDDDVFDEGEEIEIDLSIPEDDPEVIEESKIMEIEIEDISIDDIEIENEIDDPLDNTTLSKEKIVASEDENNPYEQSTTDDLVFEDVEDIDIEKLSNAVVGDVLTGKDEIQEILLPDLPDDEDDFANDLTEQSDLSDFITDAPSIEIAEPESDSILAFSEDDLTEQSDLSDFITDAPSIEIAEPESDSESILAFSEDDLTEQSDLSDFITDAPSTEIAEPEEKDSPPSLNTAVASPSMEHASSEISKFDVDSSTGNLKEEIKHVLKYMDELLEYLPEEKVNEFTRSEHFEVYNRIFEELGITE